MIKVLFILSELDFSTIFKIVYIFIICRNSMTHLIYYSTLSIYYFFEDGYVPKLLLILFCWVILLFAFCYTFFSQLEKSWYLYCFSFPNTFFLLYYNILEIRFFITQTRIIFTLLDWTNTNLMEDTFMITKLTY